MRNVSDYLEPKEIIRILGIVKKKNPIYYIALKLLFETGMRSAEMRKLNLKDVDWERNSISIHRGKGGLDRRVFFTEETKKEFLDYIEKMKRARRFLYEPDDDFPIFSWGRAGFWRMVKKCGIWAGAPELHPHALRHSFAVNCVRNKMNIRILQMLMGHTSLSMTASYLRFDDAEIRGNFDKVVFYPEEEKHEEKEINKDPTAGIPGA